MEILVIALVSGFIGGYARQQRGGDFIRGFWPALLLPIVGILIAAYYSVESDRRNRKPPQ